MATAITNQVLDVYAEGLSAAFVGDYLYESLDNFNSAVNSGVIIAALAVLDVTPTPPNLNWTATFAADALALAHISLLRGMSGFLRDGGRGKGPRTSPLARNTLRPLAMLCYVTGELPRHCCPRPRQCKIPDAPLDASGAVLQLG